jgi:cytoskeleton protein RodZ
MPKRDPDIEPVDELPVEPEFTPVGEQLRVAREEKGLSLDDLAAQTRIPQRHLASLETGDWDNLPAPTYSIGFAKSYASAVGLDRVEIGNQLREEMGGQRFASASADVFEPADPRRTMPKGLVIGAIFAVIVLIAVMSWLNSRSLQQGDEPAANAVAPTDTTPTVPAPAPAPTAAAQGQVVVTSTEPVWLQVSEKGGATLYSGTLQPGQTYAVPATATAPVLKTGKPEALRINVGNAVAPPVGPPATTVTNVSLLAADLMKAPSAQAQAPAPAPAPSRSVPRPQRARRPAAAAPSPPSAPAPEPATNATE